MYKSLIMGYYISIEQNQMTNQLTAILEDLEIKNFEEKNDRWYVFYVNGIKFELKYGTKGYGFVAAYDNQPIADLIKDEFPGAKETNKGAYYWLPTPTDLHELTEQALDLVVKESIEQQRGRKTLKTDDQGYFEKTATALKAIIDAEAYDFLTRHTFDQHDELITVGKSQAVINDPTAPTWREHIVPCTLILEETVKMVQAGCTIPQLAQMLKENLAIVVITADEAKRLDAVYQTTMPAGWQFGDNVFARLDAMNISY